MQNDLGGVEKVLAPAQNEYEPCPDARCNDHLGAAPIPQCVTAVFYAEESMALQEVAEAARDFVWEPENWEAYQDSKESNSVAWPPEFLLMAQAVEKKYGSMPIEDDDSPQRSLKEATDEETNPA